MASLNKDLAVIRDPANIEEASFASSPYVLRKIFINDPTIKRLIAAGEIIIPLITEEIRKPGGIDEITLAAFAFIVENVNDKAAPKVLGTLFKDSVDNPGPFFLYFAAHAIRSGLNLPIKPLEIDYSWAELIETKDMLR